MKEPDKIREMMDALDKNAEEADCTNTMYAEFEDGIWIISCNYEKINSMFAYDPETDRWFYQKMYGDFHVDQGLEVVGGRVSKPMRGHSEALANAECMYTG